MHQLSNPTYYYHLGLLGWPVEHSLSPRLHRAALTAAHLAGEYCLIPVENNDRRDQQLSGWIEELKQGELDGLNVTIPHKQHILPFVDDLTGSAKKIGAVNTLYYKDGRVVGENTDARGFISDLTLQFSHLQKSAKKAFIFGAGGSARAVVYALSNDNWQVTISSRRVEQANELSASFDGNCRVVRADKSHEELERGGYDLVVNCTPIGMNPYPEQSPWPEDLDFPKGICIYDLVYAPRETRLIWQAKASNIRACNGLGMLVEQAALAFEIWTGMKADRAAMKAAVE